MPDVLEAVIAIVWIFALFSMAIIYFARLHTFAKLIAEKHPDLWAQARAWARPMESRFSTAYRIFARIDRGQISRSEMDEDCMILVKQLPDSPSVSSHDTPQGDASTF